MEICFTDIIDMLERYNGMAMPKAAAETDAPVAGDPLQSSDPEIRATAEALKRRTCTSEAA
ncbi:MAG: hypothetical protein JO261_06705 [Alphaproteobacteria bacterium]|nr:hypothetical protein [Alphaproteobacteria bacterium]MBV9693374.1 hypothetical protein [Alphaproteobacteria bacterium]